MSSMQQDASRRRVIVGVDTHKFVHVAVALDANGAVIGTGNFTADSFGYQQLIDWAIAFGKKTVFAIEGTGSYGAGLTGAVRRRQVGVVEGCAPTAGTVGCAVRATPWMRRPPPAPCWPGRPTPSRSRPTAWWR